MFNLKIRRKANTEGATGAIKIYLRRSSSTLPKKEWENEIENFCLFFIIFWETFLLFVCGFWVVSQNFYVGKKMKHRKVLWRMKKRNQDKLHK